METLKRLNGLFNCGAIAFVTIADIYDWCSILILVLSILSLLFSLVDKVVDKLKKHDYQGIANDIKDTTEDIKDLTNKKED